MQKVNELPKILLQLSFSIRLTIAIICVILFLILYIALLTHIGDVTSTSTSIATPTNIANISVFAIPITLIAWMFKRYGVFVSLGSIAIILFFYHLMNNKDFTQLQTILPFGIGIGATLIVGLLISSLRDVVDLSEDARAQIALIYHQQQQLSQIKDQFILNVNHELRTPLTAVYGYLELLREYNGQIDAEMQATFIENAMHSCEDLQLLTNNILDTIQITNEQEHILIEEVYISDVIHEVLSSLDPRRLSEHEIKLDIPEYLVVRANNQYVRQILRNLLSNAFKYASVNTPIDIRAYLYGSTVRSDHPAPEICVSVRDYGPGIPSADIPRLFSQFVRLERDISGHVRGTGLGLYVSRQLVEAMDGRIWIDSTGVPGEGSCFSFVLPCETHPKTTPRLKEHSPLIKNIQPVFNNNQ